VSILFAFSRAIHFASLMTVFGASAFAVLARLESGVLRRPLIWASVAALASAILCLGFASAEIAGDPGAAFDPHLIAKVAMQTAYGHVFFVRAAPLAGVCALCIYDAPSSARAAAAGTALALLGLTSHAAASGPPQYEYLRAATDAAHLLAAGFWTGGLVALVPAALAKPRDTAMLANLLQIFSRAGMFAVAILVVAGTLNGIFILGVAGMAWSGAYVTWLAVKLVLAGLMIALALTNRFGLMPALKRGDAEAVETIPLTVIAELSCAALILLAVGFLGITAPMAM
jgi:copper resistance protein D